MIIVPIKEGENIEKSLKKFKRKFEKPVSFANFVTERPSKNLLLKEEQRSRRPSTYSILDCRTNN